MPKYRIPVENLPPPNSNGEHVFRFRIISEDRNTMSEYSNLLTIQSKGQIYPLTTSASASIQGQNIIVAWDTPSIYNYSSSASLYKKLTYLTGISASVLHDHGTDWKVHDADIFVDWGAGYEYYGRSKDNNIIIPKKVGATQIRVLGEIASYVSVSSSATYSASTRKTNSIFKIFETSQISL